ncbi:MAG: GxxExxY protein [Candidatus Marinimicrobia bacterium]|nr:GxxExxY protein [Candidatus Neomarinimicrobiota bacterium]
MNTKIIYKELSYQIVGLAMEVHSKLGPGFLEKVNENALMLLFKKNSINAKAQVPIKVTFETEIIGNYFADILVDDKIILELKSVVSIADAHKAQALNYLKATGLRLAIILNFGREKLEYCRIVN